MYGTLINALAVVIGSTIGLTIHSHLPDRLKNITFQAIGIFTLSLGITMVLSAQKLLIIILAIVSGSIIGEMLDLELHLTNLAEQIKGRLKIGTHRFTEGMITAFLVFCMGSMTILGAVEEGLGQFPRLYLTKSILDGFTAVTLAAGLGWGVLFSALPLFVYQAGLTIAARLLSSLLTEKITAELTGVGGLILIGMGLNILEIKRIKVVNMLPALFIALILALIFRSS